MFVYLGIVALVAIHGSNAQNRCITGSLSQGVCISIYECNPFLKLLGKGRHIAQSDVRLLKESRCGNDGRVPKVCCPRRMKAPRPKLMDKNPDPTPGPAVVPGPPDVSNHPRLKLVNDDICGPITETKIILGNLTTILEYPWMALIAYTIHGRSTDFGCGGTLINKRYVLTAAHCLDVLDQGMVLAGVRVGDHNLSRARDCEEENGKVTTCADKYQNFFVESWYVHAGYTRSKKADDVGLIRLDGDADFNTNNVRPICLPVGNSAMLTSPKVIVAGWGNTESLKSSRSNTLLKVTLQLTSNDDCNRVYKNNGLQISYKQICAGGQTRMDSCSGDSGGPLQLPAFTSNVPKMYQYGIVSYGSEACGLVGYPGVYTKVAYYMDWILDTIRE